MSIPVLKYPNKSHRKSVNIPSESDKLAELIGIIFGDGGINNPWQLVISLDSRFDIEYSKYIINLLTELFGIRIAVRKRPNQNTLVLVSSSMDLLDFLVSKGAVRGNKVRQQIDFPSWIQINLDFQKACVRGLMDTDEGCYFHKHKAYGLLYRNFGMCFTNYSLPIVQSVAKMLKLCDIKFSITNGGKQIYIYSFREIKKYFELIGSNNPKHVAKVQEYLQEKTHRIVV